MSSYCRDAHYAYKKVCAEILPDRGLMRDDMKLKTILTEIEHHLDDHTSAPVSDWSASTASEVRRTIRAIKDCLSKRNAFEDECITVVDPQHRHYNYRMKRILNTFEPRLSKYEALANRKRRAWPPGLMGLVLVAVAVFLFAWMG